MGAGGGRTEPHLRATVERGPGTCLRLPILFPVDAGAGGSSAKPRDQPPGQRETHAGPLTPGAWRSLGERPTLGNQEVHFSVPRAATGQMAKTGALGPKATCGCVHSSHVDLQS